MIMKNTSHQTLCKYFALSGLILLRVFFTTGFTGGYSHFATLWHSNKSDSRLIKYQVICELSISLVFARDESPEFNTMVYNQRIELIY